MAVKDYYGTDITVRFDLARCLHAAVCVRSIPAVFDTKRKPWVLPDAGQAGEIAEVVRRCPSGALHYEFTDPAAPAEAGHRPASLRWAAGQPIWLQGEAVIARDGDELAETRAALCACGSSGNRPYCDASGPCTDWRGHPH
ncbi:MAG: (4Fe-4S)-binding protein [Bifidobacteriaceae bacterium]|jgi:uncharacterized Fe-S cluster protein YjdI|nr:(4Fe-4S)-binding protein [Bifidobacteriaceae bacterium]